MSVLTAEQIKDLVLGTLKDLGRLRWTDLTSDLQEYTALPQILKKERVQFDGGIGIQRQAMVGTSNAAKHVGLYQVDNYNVADQMKNFSIPWRHTNTHYAFEEHELSMNRDEYQIFQLIKVRRLDSMVSLADVMEAAFWGKPDDVTDEITPYGIKYWIVAHATEGFNGGNPAGFPAGCGGLSSVTYPRWRNWTAKYAAISKEDLIRKWRKAATYTVFKPPVDMPTYNKGSRYGYYTNYDVIGPMEEALEAQNDNLGVDVASMDGRVLFRRIPVQWVPYLDNDATDPVYGINWGTFRPVFLRGWYLKEDGPRKAPNQHNVQVVDVDLSWNTLCEDRRRNFLISK